MVPRRSRPAADRRQSQGMIQPRGNSLEPKCIDAGGSELDGQRYPVKLAADVDDHRHIDIPQPEVAENVRCALDEQLNGREFECLGSTETARYERDFQRLQMMKALALDAERLAAGRQDLNTRRSPQHLESQTRGGLDDMLAIVEHQEHPFIAQKREQAVGRILRGNVEANRRRNRCGQQLWVADSGQIHKPKAVFVAIGEPLGSRNGDAGLTDTGRSDKSD